MKTWIIILILFFLISIVFIIGFSTGFDAGFLEGSKPQFEQCGFYYDPITNTYSIDRTQIKINFTIFKNETG